MLKLEPWGFKKFKHDVIKNRLDTIQASILSEKLKRIDLIKIRDVKLQNFILSF